MNQAEGDPGLDARLAEAPRRGGNPRNPAAALTTILALPVLLGIWLTLVVEVLSSLHLLGSRVVWRVCWAATLALAFVIVPRVYAFFSQRPPVEFHRPPAWLLAAVAGILAATFLTAIVAPPNNWDSMTYHNARVMEWWDHGDIQFWLTSIDRQLRMPPLASFFKLALYGLTGNDVLFNLVQWAFFLFSVLAGFALAQLICPGRVAAPLTALLIATMPMAILQSSSTQNDLVVAGYWLISGFFFLRAFREDSPFSGAEFLLGCVGVGLSWLTKGTALLFTTPILALAFGVAFSRVARSASVPWRRGVSTIVLGMVLAAAPNLSHWNRNIARFGSLTGAAPEVIRPNVYVDALPGYGFKLIASQLVRNAALQLDSLRFLGVTPGRLVSGVERLHDAMGLSVDDSNLAWPMTPFRSISGQRVVQEDYAGSTWHFLLAGVVTVLVFIGRPFRSSPFLRCGLALGWLAWLSICTAVPWMPWNQRLHLPVLIWLMIPTGGVLATSSFPRWLISGGATFLVAAALLPLLFNETRPLIPWSVLPPGLRGALSPGDVGDATSLFEESRWQNYFRAQQAARPAVEEVINALPSSCARPSVVALRIGADSWEYALWIGARHAGKDLEFRHVPAGPVPSDVCSVVRSDCPGRGLFCLERITGSRADE
jgi:hypothetical protein